MFIEQSDILEGPSSEIDENIHWEWPHVPWGIGTAKNAFGKSEKARDQNLRSTINYTLLVEKQTFTYQNLIQNHKFQELLQ